MTDKRDAWLRSDGVHEIEKNGRHYKNLVRFVRPCASCGEPFAIFVSQAVANGNATNNNFGLKNCELHRQTMVDKNEVEKIRSANVTMAAELTAVYARNKTLFEEMQVIKARLAQYELTPALAAAGAVDTTNSVLPKMPWDV